MKKIFVLLIILSFTLIGCGSEYTSDDELMEIYKQLTLNDFESQKVLDDEEAANKLLRDTYVEPALSEFKEGLQLMRINNIKRVYHSPVFTSIEVIQNDGILALVKVVAKYEGNEFSITSPVQNLGPFAFDSLAEVTLKKVKNSWFISEIKADAK